MAIGKVSSRQKMINLMYLVFIAMLAIQMDKKVLSSFGLMKEKIEDANTAREKNLTNYLASLEQKAEDQPEKYEELYKKAQEIHKISDNTFNYMEALKDSILIGVDQEDKKNYESMSSADKVNSMFFKGERNTGLGNEFVNSINEYRNQMMDVLGETAQGSLSTNILKRFNTDPEPAKEEGSPEIPWIRSRYEGMPMITSLANITQIQGDIRNTQSEAYIKLLGGQLEADSKLTTNNYKGIVRLEKTSYFAGDRVKGEVVLGRYDNQLVPSKVMLGDKDITSSVENGQVLLDFSAGNVGNKDIKGFISFMQDGKEEKIPFESKYSVIALPNNAIVAAEKMNVVYRGLDNPISISVPGVGDKDITAYAPGLKKISSGKYIMNPEKGSVVDIKVETKLSNGQTINTKKTYRIKDLPAASGTIRGEFGIVRMPKSGLNNAPIAVEMPDFVFDLSFNVTGFNIKVPGQPAVRVKGSKLDARAKKIIARAKRGDIITIYAIQAVESEKGVKVSKVNPVSIEISN